MQQNYPSATPPVVDWSIEPITSREESIALRLDFALPDEVVNRVQRLLLTPEQALAIAHDLQKSVMMLGTNPA